jgi:hypothetical protein
VQAGGLNELERDDDAFTDSDAWKSRKWTQKQIQTELRNSIFWDTEPCSPLKVNRRFRGTCRLIAASRWFLAWIILQPWRWSWHVPPKRWVTFNGLQCVICQATEIHNHRHENCNSYIHPYIRRYVSSVARKMPVNNKYITLQAPLPKWVLYTLRLHQVYFFMRKF